MLAPSAFPVSHAIDRSLLQVAPDTGIHEVIHLMSQSQTSYVLITSQQRILGIFTERDVVRVTATDVVTEGMAIAAVMTPDVVTLQEAEVQDIMTVLSLLRQHRIRHLPIVNSLGHPTGIVTHHSIREVIQPSDLLALRRVQDVMSTQVVHTPTTTSMLEVTHLMAQHHVSCIVIVNSTPEVSQQPIGIITERDVVKLRALGVDLAQTPAQAVMSTPIFSVEPTDPLWFAHEKMRQQNFRRLVVINKVGRLVGIITQSSLLQVLDPLEMCTALDALQHLVEQRTLELRSANQRLEIEIAERRRAESALQHQLARERLMGAIAQRIRQSLNLDTILDTTVTEVRQFLQTDRVLIYRFEPNWHGSVAVESVADQCLSILGQVVNDPCFMETYIPLYHQGRVKATEDIYASTLTPCHINLLAQFQVRANLVAPILTGEELWGLLIVHQCVGPRPWQPLEIELIKQLADQVGIAIQQAQLYQRLEEVNQELHRLATSDGLTQVANRRRFDQVLEQEWNRMTREKTPLALILCDIDFFKRYNDAYGHPIGDECLQRVAREIYLTAKRSVDLVARYGGEEFVVLLSNTSITGALHVAQEIHFRVKALRIAHVASPYEYVTLSVGVAGIIPNPDSSPAQLLAEADRALYRAKAEGRDRVVCA